MNPVLSLLWSACGLLPASEQAPPAEEAAEPAAPPAAASGADLAAARVAAEHPGAAGPIGASGPVQGALRLSPVVGDAPRTQVHLDLTWAGNGQHTVDLGTHAGSCAEIPAPPVGPKDFQKPSLWAVRCEAEGQAPVEIYALQAGVSLSAIQLAEPSPQLPDRPRYRPVARVSLVPGAELVRAN